jgi:hypothetical protein
MADLCVGTAADAGFDRDRPIRDKPWVRAISPPVKIGARVRFLVAWAAGCLLLLGFSLTLNHGAARTQSDSVLCKRH